MLEREVVILRPVGKVDVWTMKRWFGVVAMVGEELARLDIHKMTPG
jgi:hypothetical protein